MYRGKWDPQKKVNYNGQFSTIFTKCITAFMANIYSSLRCDFSVQSLGLTIAISYSTMHTNKLPSAFLNRGCMHYLQ